jgi:hypothetical protein
MFEEEGGCGGVGWGTALQIAPLKRAPLSPLEAEMLHIIPAADE